MLLRWKLPAAKSSTTAKAEARPESHSASIERPSAIAEPPPHSKATTVTQAETAPQAKPEAATPAPIGITGYSVASAITCAAPRHRSHASRSCSITPRHIDSFLSLPATTSAAASASTASASPSETERGTTRIRRPENRTTKQPSKPTGGLAIGLVREGHCAIAAPSARQRTLSVRTPSIISWHRVHLLSSKSSVGDATITRRQRPYHS